MEFKLRPKKWGSSLAVIIPKAAVEQVGIKENKEITVSFKRKHLAGEIFGILPKFKKSTQELKDEARRGWD